MTKTERDPGLVKEGQLRAERLAHTLQAAGVTRVFATDFKRTQQTAAIVAKALSLKVTTYGHTKNFLKQLAALSDGEVVLVVAHANTLPAMVKGLGGKLDGLDKWGFLPESEHDRVILQHLHSEDAEMALRAVQTLDLRIEMP